MPISREEKEFKWRASRVKFCDDTPMLGPPGCTNNDFATPKLRKCAFDLSTISFIQTVGTGRDGYCWLVKFGDEGPFVLKVFRDRMAVPAYFPPQIECRNAALLQMIEQSVNEGKVDGKPPLVIKEPSTWFDAINNIQAFPTELRQDSEQAHKWAMENNVELTPVLSVPRLRKCYGWLKIGSRMLDLLPSHIRPQLVRVSYKDKWTFEIGNDGEGNDIQYYAIVYEYIDPGENDKTVVQEVLDFLLRAGFTHAGSPCSRNWQSNVLLDLSDIVNPYERTWHGALFCRGMKAESMLR